MRSNDLKFMSNKCQLVELVARGNMLFISSSRALS
jgi:hypothetical protein